MRFHTRFIFKLLALCSLLLSYSFGFEYILEKTFMKNPMLVKKEMSLQIEKEKEAINIDIYKLKYNLTLNTIKFTLNILKNEEITQAYYALNQKLIQETEKNLSKYTKEEISLLRQKIKRENINLDIQKEATKNAIDSFKRYTKFDYQPSNILEKISHIKNPENIQKAYMTFKKQSFVNQKSLLETFVVEDIKSQITNYYSERAKFLEKQKELKSIKSTLEAELKGAKGISQILKHKDLLRDTERKIIENRYNLLFQKCKISLIVGNLLEDMKTPILKANPDVKIKKIQTALQTQPKSKTKQKVKPKKENTFKHTTLKRIHFVGNLSEVSSYSIHIVERNAQLLKEMKDYQLVLEGHSDSFGEKEKNYQLALQRAIETKKALVKFGADTNKISVVSFGDTKPIATNKTKKGRLLNRRVEFKLIKGK